MNSQLQQWPCQIKLIDPHHQAFNGSKLLIAADCTAFSYAKFHENFMKDHVTIIGCPKLDEGNYADKLQEIIEDNDIKEITVVRMEVPCCGGIVFALENALANIEKEIPVKTHIISIEGDILE